MSHPVLLAWPCNKLPNLWSFSLTVHQAHKLGFDNSCTAWATAALSIAWCRDFLWTYPQNHLQLSSKRGQGILSTVHGCKFKPIRKESQFFRIQVNPKGNQPWIFIGRTDAEVYAPILWPRDAKSWLIGKDPDAGKDWRQEEKGTTEDGWMASRTQWTWIWASPRRWWRTGSLCAAVRGVTRSQTRLSDWATRGWELRNRRNGAFLWLAFPSASGGKPRTRRSPLWRGHRRGEVRFEGRTECHYPWNLISV